MALSGKEDVAVTVEGLKSSELRRPVSSLSNLCLEKVATQLDLLTAGVTIHSDVLRQVLDAAVQHETPIMAKLNSLVPRTEERLEMRFNALSSLQPTSAALHALLQDRPSLTKLALNHYSSTDQELLDLIAKHGGLLSLDLNHSPIHGVRFTPLLSETPRLTSLSLAGVGLRDELLGGISRTRKRGRDSCETLEEDEPAPKRARLEVDTDDTSTSQELSVVPLCDQMICDYPSASSLYRLSIAGSTLSDSVFAALCRSCELLEELDCSNISTITSLSPVLGLVNLRSVCLDGCALDLELEYPDLCTWSSLRFCGTGLLSERFLRYLSTSFSTLEFLALRNKQLPDQDEVAGSPSIGLSWLSKCSELVHVDLYGVNISSHAMSLPWSEPLKFLDLAQTPFTDEDFVSMLSLQPSSPSSLQYLALPLTANSMLTSFDALWGRLVGLETLVLHPQALTPVMAEDLLKVSCRLTSLTRLECWSVCNLTPAIVRTLLQRSPRLKSLLLCATDSSLSSSDFQSLSSQFPDVEMKVWKRSFDPTDRQFLYNAGNTKQSSVTNHLDVRLDVVEHSDGDLTIQPVVVVDSIPLWTSEPPASLLLLAQTTQHDGSVPLVTNWCCQCDFDCFCGVVSYRDQSHVFWDVLEPGPRVSYRFEKGAYLRAINNARLAYLQLMWRRSLRHAARHRAEH